MNPTSEHTNLKALAQRHGDVLDKYIVAKIKKDRANFEFEKLQREVREIETNSKS